MIPNEIIQETTLLLSKSTNRNVKIISSNPLGGGSINNAFKLNTSSGNFFLKYNYKDRYPVMFEAEAKGLKLLKTANTITIPKVIDSGKTGNYSFLILEYIESARETDDFWEDFGKSLALLHQNHNDSFGLDHNNYIGSLPQHNDNHNSWVSFFIEERLERQLKMARNTGYIKKSLTSAFERLYKKLGEIFPNEKPSLIHGDLWSGNYMVNSYGKAVIIDPAVYYGHREMDIGMSKLFGGFSYKFYEAYNYHFPMEKGWERRVEICNLYPLLVHVNLFGGGYLSSVTSIVNRF